MDVASLRSERGTKSRSFAMRHPENLTARYEQLSPSQMDFDPAPAELGGRLRGSGRLLGRPPPPAASTPLLADFRPDACIFTTSTTSSHLSCSPSGDGNPAVMTLHDYKLASPTSRSHGSRRDLRGLPPPAVLATDRPTLQRRIVAASALQRPHDDRSHVRTGLWTRADLRVPQPFPARQDGSGPSLSGPPAVIPNFVDLDAFTQARTRR